MVGWSSLNRALSTKHNNVSVILQRFMSEHRRLEIQPSRWQWQKTKDMLHMYTLVGLIPALLVAGYCNIFIGPAKLVEIPEGYTPKHWEYHSHPITRFISRYFHTSFQQEYEKYMHYMYEEDEKAKLRKLTQAIKEKMQERHDYQAWYYVPVTAKYFRETKAIADETVQVWGENN